MLVNLWGRWLRQLQCLPFGWRLRRVRRKPVGCNPRALRVPLTFERLEERTLLSTLTVNSALDNTTADAFLTLREAIAVVNDGVPSDGITGLGNRLLTAGELAQIDSLTNPFGTEDTIVFDASLNGSPILLAGEMGLFTSVTIRGNGAANTVLDGQSLGRIFDISGVNVDVTLEGLTLQNGLANGSSGGAIHNTADLTLSQVVLQLNSAAIGGALANDGGTVVIELSTISNNSTLGGANGSNYSGSNGISAGSGGGLWNSGTLTLVGTTIEGNATGQGGQGGFGTNDGGEGGDGGHGGGVFNSGSLNVISSTISGNTAGRGGRGGNSYGGYGVAGHGGHGGRGGGIYSGVGSTLLVVNSTIYGNATGGGGDGANGGSSPGQGGNGGSGGGIAADAATIINTTITQNQAAGGGNAGSVPFAGSNGTAGVGGGISGGNINLSNSIVADNSDVGDINPDLSVAGTLTVSHSLISDNSGTSLIEDQDGDGSGNFIGTNANPIDPLLSRLRDNGGPTFTQALQASSPALNSGSDALAVDPTNGNAALTSDQRGLPFVRRFDGSVDSVDMGAFEAQTLAPGSLVVDTAVDENDGDYSDGDRSLREMVFLANLNPGADSITFGNGSAFGGTNFLDATPDTILLDGTSLGHIEITESVTITGTGAPLTIIDAQQLSRIFDIDGNDVDVTIDALTLTRGLHSSGEAGGAIRSTADSDSALTILNSTVAGNQTTGIGAKGGAVYSANGDVIVSASTFSGNFTTGADADGGAIYVSDGALRVIGSTFTGNTTSGSNADGGALASFALNNGITVTNSTISGNQASADLGRGGALQSIYGPVTVVNSTIVNNSAHTGGGIFRYWSPGNPRTLTIHNSIVAGNTDSFGNPDIFNRGTLAVSHSLIGNNSFNNLGGAISDMRAPTADATAAINDGDNSDNVTQFASFVGTAGTPIDPLLGALAFNGGPTMTHALLTGSLALDSGSDALAVDHTATALAADQRGFPFVRRFNGLTADTVDMGAYERQTVVGLSLVVDTAADENDGDYSDGDRSLREMVYLANGSVGTDVITFAASINGQDHLLTMGQIAITESVTITGNGAALTIVDAQTLSRIFDISGTDVDVTLDSLTLQNGRTTGNGGSFNGGAIRSEAEGLNTLSILNSTLTGNSTQGDGAGGGAVFSDNGSVIVTNSTFSNNSTNGDEASGGAIRADGGNVTVNGQGHVTITGSTFTNNAANGPDSDGGAVWADEGDVTVTGSTFDGNSTEDGDGGAISSSGANITITRTTFSDNHTDDSGDGGALFASNTGLHLVVRDSTFSGNTAADDGGAIYAYTFSPQSVWIVNSTISGNSAGDEGGGIRVRGGTNLHVVNSTVTGNYAYSYGGGIHTRYASVTIHNSIVAGNRTLYGYPDLLVTGGGASLTVSHSLIGNNAGAGLADTDHGNGVSDANGNFIGGSTFGVIDVSTVLDTTLAFNGGPTQTHALLAGSLAIDSGEDDLAVDDLAAALLFDQRGNPFVRKFDGSTDTVDMGAFERQAAPAGLLIVDNATDEFDGDYADGDRSLREVVYLANLGVGADTITFDASIDGLPHLLTMGQIAITESVTITGNGAANTVIDAQSLSRIFEVSGTDVDVTLDSLTLANGRAHLVGEGGGAIFTAADADSTLSILNSVLSGNSAAGDGEPAAGGAVCAVASRVVVTNSEFTDNFTNGESGDVADGGAIFALSGDVEVTNSTFTENEVRGTGHRGGAIWAGQGDVTITASTFDGNSADDGDGGAIFIDGDGQVAIISSTLSGNSAVGDGGAIYDRGNGQLLILNSTLSGNGAGDDGGALYAESAVVRLINSTVVNNRADDEYGGIVIYNFLSIQNSIVAGNELDDGDHIPSDINTTPDVLEYSFIGSNAGTTLTATGTAMPDLSGNYIGGELEDAIDPRLGALQDNGGPTFTHALLATSLALNSGDNVLAEHPGDDGLPGTNDANEVPLTTDQRGMGFSRIMLGTVDMGAFESQSMTFVVDTNADVDDGDFSAGNLSLREAVRLANENVSAPDFITFGDGSSNGGTNFLDGTADTILLALGQMAITDSVTITGTSAALTIIDGNLASRLFDISGADIAATFDALTLQNGRTTADDENGGAVRSIATNTSTLSIRNSILTGNSTTGEHASGGAVSSNRDVTVANSTFSGNYTTGYVATGGALYGSQQVTITDSTFSGNTTSGQGAGGGAINSNGDLTVTNSTFSDNHADGHYAYGGAIAGGGEVTIIGSTVSGNSALGNFATGGGVYAGNRLLVINSTISGNSAANEGGGLYCENDDVTLINSTVTLNQSGGDGAGVWADRDLTIHNSIVAGNTGPTEITADNYFISHSLIGDNVGTVLTATNHGAGLADANGNYIGGGAFGVINVATVLDTTLALNGAPAGSPLTHALLAGSLALNSGNDALALDQNGDPLTTDQRGTPFVRFNGTVDMGAYEAQIDFGDAPNSYGTTLAADGARHIAVGPMLGVSRDVEADGQPSALADGDGADEDGISAGGPLTAGTPTNLTINVSGAGFVNVWADLNRDGDFGDLGEQVFANLAVVTGNNIIPLLLPANFLPGEIVTRFRLTSAAVASPTPGGLLPDGEVEDYLGETTNPYLTIDGNTWNFHGTAGNDFVTVDLPNGLVTINGIVFTLLPNVEHVTVDGNAGFDRVSLIGTTAAEQVEFESDSMTLLPGSGGIDVGTQEVEGNTFTGTAGDTATFLHSAGQDRFSGRTTQSRMYGAGYDNVAVGCGTVVAESAAGGNDVAYLFDTAGDNLFTASAATASISGTGITATNFASVVGYASGGTDRAVWQGTTAMENLLGDRTLLRFSRAGMEFAGAEFERVTVVSGGGGDVARLDGLDTGIDRFTGTSASSSLTGDGYAIYALGFTTVIADAKAGASDTAELIGSPGNDQFIGGGNSAALNVAVVPAVSYTGLGFDQVTIRGLGGTNRRTILSPLQYTPVYVRI